VFLYISLGETDEWAHAANTPTISIRASSRCVRAAIWELAQSMPEYRGTTTLIFSPIMDAAKPHTNGKITASGVPDSQYIWMALNLGPDTPPALGERAKITPVTQTQIAATLAGISRTGLPRERSKAGKPIADVLPH